MKLIIAGGRAYTYTLDDVQRLDAIHECTPVTLVLSGGASGADAFGERWAEGWGIPVQRFPADWGKHGLAAGPIRNRAMAEVADAVVLFPGGRGTANMAQEAAVHGLVVYDFRG